MDVHEYLDWEILYEVEEAERNGEDTAPKKKVVSDPAEIRRFFAAHSA